MNGSITVQNLSMRFNLSRQKEERFKEYIINMVKGRLKFDEFWALKDISFSLEKGDSLGIIGLNGAGKTTLLKLVSGIMQPTQGSVLTKGTIAPLIELSGGFDGNLTAKENIFFTGSMHGHSKKFLTERYDQIIDFAELAEFADVPVRNFSSGMRSRLGFAIATQIEPDILILDEILSVGDYTFKEKSLARTQAMIKSGATVLFVSHSADQVKKLCSKALWLEHGTVFKYGDAKTVCDEYSKHYQKEKGHANG